MENMIVTNKGRELMAEAISQNISANFSHIAVSEKDYSNYTTTTLEYLNTMEDIVGVGSISDVIVNDYSTLEVYSFINNKDLEKSYNIRALGLYAKNLLGEEILYGISIVLNNPDNMPVYDGENVVGITYKLITKFSNTYGVSLLISEPASVHWQDLERWLSVMSEHHNKTIVSQSGVHGLRYYNDSLQIYDEDSGDWSDVGVRSYTPNNVSGLDIEILTNGSFIIYWSDPDDIYENGEVVSQWAGTKLVMNKLDYGNSVHDGDLLIDNTVKNKYKTTGYTVTGLVAGETYYFQLYPYSTTNKINVSEKNRISGTAVSPSVMTFKIDLNNNNHSTSVTYADDALNLSVASEKWDTFFGHRPCLFKDGQVVGYLNPNNYSEFEDGSSADITTGNSGDVMVEFPRRGLKIEKNDLTNIVTVSMTDEVNADGFEYLAHSIGDENRDFFYIGAYLGNYGGTGIQSLSGKIKSSPVGYTPNVLYAEAQKRGAGYELLGFYQMVYLQAMFIMKYKSVDSATTIGYGADSTTNYYNGRTNTYGMDYGNVLMGSTTVSSSAYTVKLFGIEDLWGRVFYCISGYMVTTNGDIMVSNSDFNCSGLENGIGTKVGNMSDVEGTTLGYMHNIFGNTKSGFLSSKNSYATDKYLSTFNSYANYTKGNILCFGGSYTNGDTGANSSSNILVAHSLLNKNSAITSGNFNVGVRLMYI